MSVMRRHLLTLAAPVVGLSLLLSGCAKDDSAATTTTSSEVATTAATADLASVTEITSPDAVPTTIDAPDNVVPPEPTAPPDEFAVGKDTPKDPKGRPFLSPGDEGDDVVAMQRRLIDLGGAVDDSGVYDDATLAAVLQFQRSQGLVADGIVGTKTWAALDSPKAPSSTPTTVAPSAQGDGAAIPAVEAPANDPAEKNDSKVTGAIVVLSSQKVVLFAGSKPVAEFPVSSGRNGLTPVGSFKVQSKSPRTVSNSDNTIGMKWMTRFNGGIGFHGIPVRKDGTPLATPLGQRPVSAGCIRMRDDDAKRIFDQLPIGGTVVVAR